MEEQILEQLYTWIDGIPLSRPKKDLKRDFSDGGIFFHKILYNDYPVPSFHMLTVVFYNVIV